MDNNFFINLSEKLDISGSTFGVFSNNVKTPDYHICTKGEKPFARLFYVVRGTIIFNRKKGDSICAHAGSVVYLPNDITYISEWPGDETGEFISINFKISETLLSLPDKICIAADDKNEYYLKMFKDAYHTWIHGSIGYKFEVLSQIFKIFCSLKNDSMRRQTKQQHQAIYKGVIYLENNYLEDITASELAVMCNTSESNFRRLFKKYKSMSPVTYRNYLRIKKACDLLRGGEYSIAEAAAAVNIPDLCYFYKLFKKFMKTAPKSFVGD